jgi:hypothetical protein
MNSFGKTVSICGLVLLAAGALSIDVRAQSRSRPSSMACDRYAQNYSEGGSRQGQVLGGAAKGGLLGAGIGAIAGGAGVGAAIGMTVGVIGGGSRRRETANRMYNAAYQDCMAGRVR